MSKYSFSCSKEHLNKYVFSVLTRCGDIVMEELHDSYDGCISKLQSEEILDEAEDIIDDETDTVIIYRVADDFQLGVNDITDMMEVTRIYR